LNLKSRGFSLIELLILVVLISVVATAFWNFQLNNSRVVDDGYLQFAPDSSVRMALDNIGYHIRFAGRGFNGKSEPIQIIPGDLADRLLVFHSDSCYEYLLEDGRLIEQSGRGRKILASDVTSLKFVRMGRETVVVTVSKAGDATRRPDTTAAARSYSAVVHADALY